MKKHLPNLVTLLNLLCGVLAVICIFEYSLHYAAWLILAGAVFDFLDGLVARALGVSGELGKQLDSLADVVTFGVAPGLIGYSLMAEQTDGAWYSLFPLMIPLFGAYRLARFNIDTRQSDSFIGLPIPANALFWLALPLMVYYDNWFPGAAWMFSAEGLAVFSILFSLLMVSQVKLMALKFKHVRWNDNQWRYIFVLISAVLFFFFFFAAIPIILLLYVLISIIQNRLQP